MLARAPELITVGEVLQFLEGGKGKKRAPRASRQDPFHELWTRVDDAIADILDTTSFAGLVREWRERRSSYVPDWQI